MALFLPLQLQFFSNQKIDESTKKIYNYCSVAIHQWTYTYWTFGWRVCACGYLRTLCVSGNDVAFICGSDEHGVPITIKAKKEGVSPQDIVDKYHAIIKKSFEDFGISFDNYSRTSAKIHHETAQEFFKTLYDKGEFIEEVTEQLYDEEADQFLADRFVTGTCPKCGNEEAYGDQCEKCGSSLNATDLINPKSAINGKCAHH